MSVPWLARHHTALFHKLCRPSVDLSFHSIYQPLYCRNKDFLWKINIILSYNNEQSPGELIIQLAVAQLQHSQVLDIYLLSQSKTKQQMEI